MFVLDHLIHIKDYDLLHDMLDKMNEELDLRYNYRVEFSTVKRLRQNSWESVGIITIPAKSMSGFDYLYSNAIKYKDIYQLIDKAEYIRLAGGSPQTNTNTSTHQHILNVYPDEGFINHRITSHLMQCPKCMANIEIPGEKKKPEEGYRVQCPACRSIFSYECEISYSWYLEEVKE